MCASQYNTSTTNFKTLMYLDQSEEKVENESKIKTQTKSMNRIHLRLQHIFKQRQGF